MKTYTDKQAKKLHGIYTANQLAELLGLLPFDDETGTGKACYDDDMWEAVEDHALFNYAFERGYEYRPESYTLINDEFEIDVHSVRDKSKLLEKCHDEAATDLYKGWKRALESTVERVLESVDLDIQPCKIKMIDDGYTADGYEIVPCGKRTWREVVVQVMNCSSGYYNDNLTDFKANYGSTDRSASIRAFEADEWKEWYGGSRRVQDRMNDYLNHYLCAW